MSTVRKAILAFALCGAGLAPAQTITTGEVAGVVKDTSGAVIPAATVTLKSADSGEARTVKANDEGSYHLPFLKPGTYTISEVAPGLRSDLTQLTVEVGQFTATDLVAKVEARREVIEIRAGVPIVETENANQTTTYTTQQIRDLPMPGGDITTIAFTVPGVVMNTGAGAGNFSSHGLPSISNLFTINGDDYNDPTFNTNNAGPSGLLLGQAEIEEASIVQNGYSVQYGRQAGANVNYVTKSGTNSLHGDLLYNFNNHLLNANDFFNNATGIPRPYAISQQWGADFGGPAIRNRLFWFADSEGLYFTLPTSGVVAVPSQPLETYILGNLKAIQRPLYQTAFNLWNSAPGEGRAVPVTNGEGLLQDGLGRMGCGRLAAEDISAPGGGVFGQNVSCLNAWGTSGTNTNREWLNTARADWNINTNQKIFFRFKGDHGFQPSNTNLINPALSVQAVNPQYEGQINHTAVISPTIVNNLIFSIFWFSFMTGPPDSTKAEALFPAFFSIGGPATNSGGVYPMGAPWYAVPRGRRVGQGQLVDDFSVVKGSHSFKTGVNLRRNRVTTFLYEAGQIGSYFFANLVDFANGVTNANSGSAYLQVFSPLKSAHLRFYNLGVYAMDEWSIRPNLKLTWGLRLDRTANPACLDRCISRLTDQFSLASFVKDAGIPYNSSIQTGLAHAYYNVDPVVLDPRASVVWSPKKGKGTVLRAGFGLFSDVVPNVLAANIFTNAPNPYNAVINQGQEVGLVSDPSSAAAAALNQFNAFKTGFFGGQTLAQLSNSVPGFSPPGYFSMSRRFLSPQYAEWSFEIEQPVGSKSAFITTYNGNYGYNLLIQNGFVNAYLNGAQLFPNGFGGLPLAPPDPRFSAITELTNSGMSRYNGLTIQFRRSLRWGFQGQISYTWSHALDDMSNGGAGLVFSAYSSLGVIPSPSTRGSYSNADYDVRHNLLADFVWNTPWKLRNHFLDKAVNNWTLGGKFFLRSGSPFSVYDSQLAGFVSPNIAATILASYAVSSGVARHCGASAVNTPCLSLSDFVPSLQESTYGNVARNSFYGTGYFDIDATLYKSFPLREGVRFSVGAQAYNLMNHPHFAPPNGDIAGGGFGSITSTVAQPTGPYGAIGLSGRTLVLTGRLNF